MKLWVTMVNLMNVLRWGSVLDLRWVIILLTWVCYLVPESVPSRVLSVWLSP